MRVGPDPTRGSAEGRVCFQPRIEVIQSGGDSAAQGPAQPEGRQRASAQSEAKHQGPSLPCHSPEGTTPLVGTMIEVGKADTLNQKCQ